MTDEEDELPRISATEDDMAAVEVAGVQSHVRKHTHFVKEEPELRRLVREGLETLVSMNTEGARGEIVPAKVAAYKDALGILEEVEEQND